MRYTPVSLALPAALIGLALVSCASAQESPATRSQSRQSFAYQMSNGDGSSIELRIENGDVVVAKVDGKSIPPDRVRTRFSARTARCCAVLQLVRRSLRGPTHERACACSAMRSLAATSSRAALPSRAVMPSPRLLPSR